MTRRPEDAGGPASHPARRASAGAPGGLGRRARPASRWWPPMVVAAGAGLGAGLGYRVGARLDRGADQDLTRGRW
jgi:hypothetical protein